MKIWVPPQGLIFDGVGDSIPFVTDMAGDFTIEAWLKPVKDPTWKHIAAINRLGKSQSFVDGQPVTDAETLTATGGRILTYKEGVVSSTEYFESVYINELRISNGVARGLKEMSIDQISDPEYPWPSIQQANLEQKT
jgi:hypothetical protein